MNPLHSCVESLAASDENVLTDQKLQGHMQGHVITSSASSSSTPLSSPSPKRLDMSSFKSLGEVFLGGMKKNASFLNQSSPSLSHPDEDQTTTQSGRKFSVPVLPSVKLKESKESSSETISKATLIPKKLTVNLGQMKLIQEMIQTEKTFFENLAILEEAYAVFQKKRRTFFDFIDEKKPDSVGGVRTGLKEKAALALSNLLENAVLLKTPSKVLIEVLESSPTIERVAATFAGLNYQSFGSVGENYNKYTSFQRKLAKEEQKEFAKKVNKLLSKEVLKRSNLKFEDYAITLVQRPPRYELFLKQLQETIDQTSGQVQADLQMALKRIQMGTANMNEKVRYTVLFNPQEVKKFHEELSEGSSDKSDSHSSSELPIEVSSSDRG